MGFDGFFFYLSLLHISETAWKMSEDQAFFSGPYLPVFQMSAVEPRSMWT